MSAETIAVYAALLLAAAAVAYGLPGWFRELWSGSPVCGVCAHPLAWHHDIGTGVRLCNEWGCRCSTPVAEAE